MRASLSHMKQPTPRFGKADLPRLGRHIRDLRLASGRTQVAVAALAGLAESTVGAVEAGRSNPSLPTIVALAAALGVGIDQLVAEAAHRPGRAAVTRASPRTGDLSAGLVNSVLKARSLLLPQGARHPTGPDGCAQMIMVLHGVVQGTTSAGDRLRLDAGDTCHARTGALGAIAGLGAQPAHLLCVTDTRLRPLSE